MRFDFLLTNVRLQNVPDLQTIGVSAGEIAYLGTELAAECPRVDGLGNIVFPGFVDCHIHLDKAAILDRCSVVDGTLAEAVSSVQQAKAAFTEDDVYARAAAVITRAIGHGTTLMRSFVEVDESAGMVSLAALIRIQSDFSHAIELEICAFAQDGTSGDSRNLALLGEAMSRGAQLVGGCPYTDSDPARHVADIFDLAEHFGTDVDFHIDFNLNPAFSHLPLVIAETLRRSYGGRVSLGHVTNLSMLPPERVMMIGRQLADAGISVVALPATDLFLMGREHEHSTPRGIAPLHALAAAGVRTAIGTNNVLNPFTPFGNTSMMRMADLYMHAAQLRTDRDIAALFDMVTVNPAAMLGRPFGLQVGQPATFVLLDAPDPVAAMRGQVPAVAGWYRGQQTFSRSLTMAPGVQPSPRQEFARAFNA